MKISKIKFNNFRIYKGENEITFLPNQQNKNINIVAGKNGFGKTTFLTSLIWCFYGKMMVEVEEKYKKDIKNAGGYEKFLNTLLNRDIKNDFEQSNLNDSSLSMEVELSDISIPSLPCERVLIKRSYNLSTENEILEIYIDGLENELAKEVGLELFINDFILPREIAKFFFFDAEKIVTLAEAKSKSELKNLSRAYSEVLGIKKYEDLKKNLETLLVKLRRNGAKPDQQIKLQQLIEKEKELKSLTELCLEKKTEIEKEILSYSNQSDSLQEKLIREGSGITLEELTQLKLEQELLKKDSDEIRGRLKKMIDLVPIVMAGQKLVELSDQLESESFADSNFNINIDENPLLKKSILNKLQSLNINISKGNEIIKLFQDSLEQYTIKSNEETSILLDYTPEQARAVKAIIDNVKNGFNIQFQNIVREEKNNKLATSKVFYKIKQAEARKGNAVAQKLREEKSKVDQRILQLSQEKGGIIEELNSLESQVAINSRVLSEYEKNFKLVEADIAKSEVTEKLLLKISKIIQRVKEDKKYSLQKSILLGLKKIMHKNDFVHNVKVNVYDDIMDIDLLDSNDKIIDKESLSKGEQQLYATALLKALVDESGIKFPVFIDSPLQKFDKFHSQNIIREFYPSISDQVVLFPLLEKELSEMEYKTLQPHVNKVYVIDSENGASKFKFLKQDQLFIEIKNDEDYVHSN
ncbi:AAA family ATPase [Chryseobacterium sp. JV274]|uniref:AAA family ATPase n=1 Tax=Chryseobacterium sp. JV274 TaxID=1932669 RepID=UPI0015C21714|nr:AAA family ATPase [Chryseobacterium sp. JV274]CAD0224630.1 DNA sulfur modification protein DndD [Chryseobacterium sp. JV274]